MDLIPDISEDVLCKKCIEGDRQAWEALITEYGMPMRDLMARFLGSGDHHALDDLFGEFWWTLLKDRYLVLRRFEKEKGSLTAYFSGVVRKLVRTNQRRENSRNKRQISLSKSSPDSFPIKVMSLMQVISDLEGKATNAERRFLRDWLMQPPGSEVHFSETNRRALTSRLLDKVWPLIHGDGQCRPRRR